LSKVLLFSTSTCSWCRKAKRYFKERRVAAAKQAPDAADSGLPRQAARPGARSPLHPEQVTGLHLPYSGTRVASSNLHQGPERRLLEAGHLDYTEIFKKGRSHEQRI
jgi:hypothetical protein